MAHTRPTTRLTASVSLKLGRALEAHATGWGVAVLPLLIALLVAGAAMAWAAAP